jgi:hypothetical protein
LALIEFIEQRVVAEAQDRGTGFFRLTAALDQVG